MLDMEAKKTINQFWMSLDEFNRTPLITYSMYLKEQTKKYKENKFNTQNWTYDKIRDEFICPDNRRLSFKRYV